MLENTGNRLTLKISRENLTQPCPDKIKYSTALSYKGLERDSVVLVIKDVFNASIDGLYQLLIGDSKVIDQHYLLLVRESVIKTNIFTLKGFLAVTSKLIINSYDQ